LKVVTVEQREWKDGHFAARAELGGAAPHGLHIS